MRARSGTIRGLLATLELAPAPPRTRTTRAPRAARQTWSRSAVEPRELVLLAGTISGAAFARNPSFASFVAGALDVAVQLAEPLRQPRALGLEVERPRERDLHEPAGHDRAQRAVGLRRVARHDRRCPRRRSSVPIRSPSSSQRRPGSASGTPTVTASVCETGCGAARGTGAPPSRPPARGRARTPPPRRGARGAARATAAIDDRLADAEPLPDLLGHERHDRVQQAERPLEDPREHGGGVGALLLGPVAAAPFSSSSPQSQSSDHDEPLQRLRRVGEPVLVEGRVDLAPGRPGAARAASARRACGARPAAAPARRPR